MNKYIKISIVILSVFLLKFMLSFTLNEIVIHQYENNKYNDSLTRFLYLFNFSEPYIVYYNHGNLLYQKENYEKAQEKYQQALEKHPSKKRVCDIRINLSLSTLALLDPSKGTVSKELEEAKKNLYEDNCADPFDLNYRSEEAQELKKEIEQLEEQMGGGSGETDDPNDSNDDQEDQNEKEIEQKLKEIQKQANGNRQTQNQVDLYDFEAYTGKRW